MNGTMAEYKVRVVRQDNETTVQLIINDRDIVAATELEPMAPRGNELYLRLFQDTLTAIKPRLMVS